MRQPVEEHARRRDLREVASVSHERAHRRARGRHMVLLRLARLRRVALAGQLVRRRLHDGGPLHGPRPHPHVRHLRVQRQLCHVRMLGGLPRLGAVERHRLRRRRQPHQRRCHGAQDPQAHGRGSVELRALHALHGLVHPGDPVVHLQHHGEGGEGRIRGMGAGRPRLHARGRGLRHIREPRRRHVRPQPAHDHHHRCGRRRGVGKPRRHPRHLLGQGGEGLVRLRPRRGRVRGRAAQRLHLRVSRAPPSPCASC